MINLKEVLAASEFNLFDGVIYSITPGAYLLANTDPSNISETRELIALIATIILAFTALLKFYMGWLKVYRDHNKKKDEEKEH